MFAAGQSIRDCEGILVKFSNAEICKEKVKSEFILKHENLLTSQSPVIFSTVCVQFVCCYVLDNLTSFWFMYQVRFVGGLVFSAVQFSCTSSPGTYLVYIQGYPQRIRLQRLLQGFLPPVSYIFMITVTETVKFFLSLPNH